MDAGAQALANVQNVAVPVIRVRDVPLPVYATEGSAGADLTSAESFELAPLERRMVPTGLKIELPPGFEGQVRPRSGLAAKSGVGMVNSPGTIDCDFRGEIHVILVNLSNSVVQINQGDRIAQLVVNPIAKAEWVEVQELSASSRGAGGFGSTGA